MEQANINYDEDFAVLLDEIDAQLDDDFWESYDPE